MGNSITKNPCFSGDTYAVAVSSDSVTDESHGHSFRYVPTADTFHKSPTTTAMSSGTTFFSLSGAAISANQVTSSSMSPCRLLNELTWPQSSACTFESSRSFAAAPLQAAPTRFSMSGPLLSMSGRFSDTSGTASTISNRMGRPFMSETLDHSFSSSSSFVSHQANVSPPVAERGATRSRRCNERPLFQFFTRAASRLKFGAPRYSLLSKGPVEASNMESYDDGVHLAPPNDNVQWAQGMVGEDRFHVAVSEEHGWAFVGIYDGFNGPDATDYLVANLYVALRRELKGVLWNNIQCDEATSTVDSLSILDGGNGSPEFELKPAKRGGTELPETDDATTSGGGKAMHSKVFKAMAQALRKTEEEFFKAAEQQAAESPELGLMGSCVLVMLMKGPDVYVMNVGDSRAVLAGRREPDLENILGKTEQDLQQVKAEIMRELKSRDVHGLECVQLNNDHSTADDTEVKRVRDEHPSDSNSIIDGRVKGKLNLTRAFGAGYLKEPKWNSRLLAAFKIDYIGSDPYINCIPSVCHYRVGPNDKFLVLSSDGLYQYFTKKEVVDHVEMFTAVHPKGDPAQHLIGELLLRAARKAGMDCRELLEIPCGERRKYHDDVSIIVISFKGTIWRSSV